MGVENEVRESGLVQMKKRTTALKCIHLITPEGRSKQAVEARDA
jgi:hypothetical protein